MQSRLIAQLVVLFSLFTLTGCSLFKSGPDNPCDCVTSQENELSDLSLGKSGPAISTLAQSFTVSENKTISKVAIKIGARANYSAQLRLTLYPDDGSGAPNLSAPIISTPDRGISTSANTWTSFCFSNDCVTSTAPLTANTTYWFVLVRPNGVDHANTDTSQYFTLAADSRNSYTAGMIKIQTIAAPGVWTTFDSFGASISNYDLAFRVGCTNTTAIGCQ